MFGLHLRLGLWVRACVHCWFPEHRPLWPVDQWKCVGRAKVCVCVCVRERMEFLTFPWLLNIIKCCGFEAVVRGWFFSLRPPPPPLPPLPPKPPRVFVFTRALPTCRGPRPTDPLFLLSFSFYAASTPLSLLNWLLSCGFAHRSPLTAHRAHPK